MAALTERVRRGAAAAAAALALSTALTACGGRAGGSVTTTGASGAAGSAAPSGAGADNGVAGRSADAIVRTAASAGAAASSAHVSGTIRTKGQTIGLDITLATGKGAAGSVTLDGEPLQLVVLDRTAYLKAGDGFWRAHGGAAAAQLLAGKWLKVPATGSSFSAFASFTNLSTLMRSIADKHGTLAKGATTTIAGQAAIEITDQGKGGTLAVATTGTPYPLRVTGEGLDGSGASGSGTITFSGYDQPVTLTVPAGVVDLAKLQHG